MSGGKRFRAPPHPRSRGSWVLLVRDLGASGAPGAPRPLEPRVLWDPGAPGARWGPFPRARGLCPRARRLCPVRWGKLKSVVKEDGAYKGQGLKLFQGDWVLEQLPGWVSSPELL